MKRAFVAAPLLSVALQGTAAHAAECAYGAESVVITGSTAAKPLIAELAKLLAAAAPAVLLGRRSCTWAPARAQA